MKLRRITTPATWQSTGGTHYETPDGRFRVYRTYGYRSEGWQARALDGSTPFRSTLFGRTQSSNVYNGDTLADCRDEIAYALEQELHPST